MREASMDRNQVESVFTLMREEYAEEAELASDTIDDVSSHSSQAITSSAAESNGSLSPQRKENMAVAENGSAGEKQMTESNVKLTGDSFRSYFVDLSSDLAWISKNIFPEVSAITSEGKEKEQSSNIEDEEHESGVGIILEHIVDGGRDAAQQPSSGEGIFTSPVAQENISDLDNKTNNTLDSALNHIHDDVDASSSKKGDMPEGERINSSQNGSADNEIREIIKIMPTKELGMKRAVRSATIERTNSSQIFIPFPPRV